MATCNISDAFLTKDELAEFLGKSSRTLDRWHSLRIGPPRIKAQSLILYRRAAVFDWLARHETYGRDEQVGGGQ